MTIKEHYDNHLGNIYSWMVGQLEDKQSEFQKFAIEHELYPHATKIAIDCGAGHGIQTIALAKMGYTVKAIDFSIPLLNELVVNTKGMNVEIINENIVNIDKFAHFHPELIVCCGDTLTHLNSEQEIEQFITNASNMLIEGGKLLLTFRDYSIALTGIQRFIPVKSDEDRILTCILDYETDFVNVTDLLYEKNKNSWAHKISSYKKVRINPNKIIEMINQNNMIIQLHQIVNNFTTIIAYKWKIKQN